MNNKIIGVNLIANEQNKEFPAKLKSELDFCELKINQIESRLLPFYEERLNKSKAITKNHWMKLENITEWNPEISLNEFDKYYWI